MDPDGNVYLVEETGHRVDRVSPDGKIVPVAGTFFSGYETHADGVGLKATSTPINWPRSCTMGPDGNLYFGDVFNMRIRALCLKPASSFGVDMTETGKIYDIVGDPDVGANQGQAQNGYAPGFARRQGEVRGAKLAGVRGIAFDHDGNMIFTDTWGWSGTKGDPTASMWHHVRVVCNKPGTKYGVEMTAANHVYSIAGKDWDVGFDGDAPRPAKDALIDYAQSVVVDGQDNILFVDSDNYRIRKITVDGTISTFAGSGCWDLQGNCTASSTGDGGQAINATLGAPYGLALDKERGLLFVSEKSSNFVRVIDLKTGIIRTIIGRDASQSGGTAGDGIARMIYLNQPHDLLLDPAGDLYVTSSRAHKVYKFLTSIL
jgi:sugar lactone lactonase YvrE